jgi:hypothetical protein
MLIFWDLICIDLVCGALLDADLIYLDGDLIYIE